MKSSTVVNPIIDWTDKDIWDYIADSKIECNPLYCEGFKRVGCIGCPMAASKGRYSEFYRYPKFKQMYIHAFERMLQNRIEGGLDIKSWRNGYDVFRWWLGENPMQEEFNENESE